jgi:hypothetical protein
VLDVNRETLHQYTPHSDFSVIVRNLPVLILEVTSDQTSETDRKRMQLHASCLVRLGNALLQTPEHLTRAIYIDGSYQATEYTFFQGNDPVFIPLNAE